MPLKVIIQIAMELWGAILCFLFAVFIALGKDRSTQRAKLLMAMALQLMVHLISDSVAYLTRGDTGALDWYLVRISNFLVFILYYSLSYSVMLYIDELMRPSGHRLPRWLTHAVGTVCILGTVIVTVSQPTGFLYTIGADNLYARSCGYWIVTLLGAILVVMLVSCVFLSLPHIPPTQSAAMLALLLLTLGANAMQLLLYGISLIDISMTIGAVFMFIAFEKDRLYLISKQERELLENKLKILEQKVELAKKDSEIAIIGEQLTEKRTKLILSQIQPHFLYNALSAISYLCTKEPEKAQEAINCFAEYLRTNLSSLRSDRVVPFSEELKHTQAYLSIEQLRFGEELHLVYDTPYTDFCLPSLSLQPVVENAVRHGICGREDGGTVTIRTEEEAQFYRISVIDDGIGFDPSQKPEDGKDHVGVENVCKRLELLVNGRLEITSVPGQGTTAILRIPKQEA